MSRQSKLLKGALTVFAVSALIALAGYFFFKKEGPADEFHIAVSIPPYYVHTEHRAEIGEYSEGLSAMDRNVLLKTVEKMDKDWRNLPASAMYVAALRLFEIGERDRALYWYQGARYRADLMLELLDSSSGMNRMGSEAYTLSRAHTAFFTALRPHSGGHGLCDIRKYEEAIQRAVLQKDTLPNMSEIYPEVAFLPEEQWQSEAEKVKARFEARLKNTVDNYDRIVGHRKASGVHERYCEKDSLTTEDDRQGSAEVQ